MGAAYTSGRRIFFNLAVLMLGYTLLANTAHADEVPAGTAPAGGMSSLAGQIVNGTMSCQMSAINIFMFFAVIGSVFILSGGKDARTQIPFGPFLSLGALSYLFFGRQISLWYFGLFV